MTTNRIDKPQRTKQVVTWLTDDEYAHAAELARKEDRNISNLIRRALNTYGTEAAR